MQQTTDQLIETLCASAEQAASSTDEALANSEFAATMKSMRAENGAERQSSEVTAEQEIIRAIFARLLEQNRSRIESTPYPSRVHELTQKEFARIQTAVDEEPHEYFTLSAYLCRCDLRILSFGRRPVGPEHLEIDGLPRSVAFKGGIGQFARATRLFVTTKGFKPFFVTHLGHGYDPATFLFSYSKRAQKKMFLTIAECLQMHPEVKGLLAGSWWHDPQLEDVAPHLTYLRTGWTDNGADIFFWESSEEIDEVATRNSPARRELLEKGEYKPRSYIAVWPRESLLAWAESERAKAKKK